MALNEMMIEAFESTARRLVDKIDVANFIEMYAANPDLAGSELTDILNNLPTAPETKSTVIVDAFIAMRLLEHTHEQIGQILGEDMYMQEQLDEHDSSDVDVTKSLPPDTPTTKREDRAIRDSARGDEDQKDVDRYIRQESTRNDDDVRRSAMQGEENDSSDIEKKQVFDFRMEDPLTTFRKSTSALVNGIIKAAFKNRRLQPLFDHQHRERDDVYALSLSLRSMVGALRFDDGGNDDDDDDDENAGEGWR